MFWLRKILTCIVQESPGAHVKLVPLKNVILKLKYERPECFECYKQRPEIVCNFIASKVKVALGHLRVVATPPSIILYTLALRTHGRGGDLQQYRATGLQMESVHISDFDPQPQGRCHDRSEVCNIHVYISWDRHGHMNHGYP